MSSEEFKALKASLRTGSQPAEAALSLTEPTRKVFSEGGSEDDIEESLWKAWYSVIDVAASTPHRDQQPLVDTLLAVQQRNIGKDEAASESTVWGNKVKIWKDMPLFGAATRQAWNRGE